MTPLDQLKTNYEDTPEYHQTIHEQFVEAVNGDELLNVFRTYIEQNVLGMGERSFPWFWKLLVDELPDVFTFCELGVHKGQILSLIRLLANREGKLAGIIGVTPLNGSGTGWTQDDYYGDIARLHEHFELQQPVIVEGYSQDVLVIKAVRSEYDVIYIDGDHTLEGALSDLVNYSPMVKSGGYLVIDDAACRTNQPFGYFQGIDTVGQALEEWESSQIAKDFDFQFNVVHLMIYKRK